MLSKEQEQRTPGLAEGPPPPKTLIMRGSQTEHRELLRRVITSTTFVRSARLCSLLTYVCDMVFQGRGSEINEQKIGQAVFGRSRDYDSTVDGIVRTQASRLRQRLEHYFRDEGAHETMRIVIPRGGYVPVFEPRTVSLPTAAVIEAPVGPLSAEEHTSSARGELTVRVLPWILCVLLAAAVIAQALRGSNPPAPSAARPHVFWSHIFSADRPTLVVPADSGLVLYHNMSRRGFGLDEYLLGDYRTNAGAQVLYGAAGVNASLKDWLVNLANRRYTSVVDLEAILSMSQLARSSGSTLQVRYARDLRPNDLKSGNVILMGASESDPWVELFERNMNFVFQDDYKTGVFSVLNQSPHAGEPARWTSVWNDPQRRVYGLIAYVPNLSGDGNALIIEGTSMSGTEGARDFVMDDSQLGPFLKSIERPGGSIPHFEVLLGTQNLGASAVHNQLLAWRTSD